MHNEGEEIHVDADEVRGGESRGVMRWVLGISVLIAAGAMTIAWVSGALSQGDVESQATVSGKMDAAEEGDNTDGVVGVPDDFSQVEPAEPADGNPAAE